MIRPTLLFACLILPLAAQNSTEPPALIRVVRDWSGPGPDPNIIAPYANAKAPVEILGMTAVTGVLETWLIESHDSFSTIEDVDNALASVSVQGPAAQQRTLIALYLPALSYRPDDAVRGLAKARYFQVSICLVRPGTDGDFANLVKLRRQGLDRVNMDRPELVYRVVLGAESGTYLFFAPLASLQKMDNGLAKNPAYVEAITDGGQNTRKLAGETQLSLENHLFRVQPAISFVSDDFAAGDPDFWRPGAPREP